MLRRGWECWAGCIRLDSIRNPFGKRYPQDGRPKKMSAREKKSPPHLNTTGDTKPRNAVDGKEQQRAWSTVHFRFRIPLKEYDPRKLWSKQIREVWSKDQWGAIDPHPLYHIGPSILGGGRCNTRGIDGAPLAALLVMVAVVVCCTLRPPSG